MKNAYPITMVKGEKRVVAYAPDFAINTEGDDYADDMAMARDAIGLIGIDMEDDGEAIPQPSAISQIKSNGIVTLVDVDFTEYRRKHDMSSIR